MQSDSKAGHARTRTLSLSLYRDAALRITSPTVESWWVTSGFLPDTSTRCHTLQHTRRHTPLEISIRSKTRNNGWFEGINSSRDSRPAVTLLRYAVDLLLLLLLLFIRVSNRTNEITNYEKCKSHITSCTRVY